MKKVLLTIIAVCFLMVLGATATTSAAQHFNYDEAYQILNGKWTDTKNGETLYPVWKSNDGSESNIVANKGYTDRNGDSKIFFDRKGVPAYMQVTYYPDQDKYYAKLVILNVNAGRWHTYNECLVRE